MSVMASQKISYTTGFPRLKGGSMISVQKSNGTQRGSALIISLVILLVLTLIGITGMQTTVLEEKMSGNFRDKNIAFQAAESAMRDAENVSKGRNGHVGMTSSCANGLCYSGPSGSSAADMVSHLAAGYAVDAPTSIPGLAQPKYLIDGVKSWAPGGAGWRYMYRITVVATGHVSTTQSVLRGTYYPQ